MIVYKKTPQLRIRRHAAPEPPWWCAVSVAPYGTRRAAPLAIDYIDLHADVVEKMEVPVAEEVTSELDRIDRKQPLAAPLLIEASEFAEHVFRRGDEIHRWCDAQQLDVIQLVSTRGVIPENASRESTLAIAAWPLEFDRIRALASDARNAKMTWGLVVPVMYPVTTDLQLLGELAAVAHEFGAAFLAPLTIELDPTAKQAIARSLTLNDDDETWTTLFHADLEALHVATERHIAALSAELGIADSVVPPRSDARTNWNAAILLTLTSSRMIAMKHETELASMLMRSARVIAALDKPLARIAESASLSIIEALDDVSVDILGEWLEGAQPAFVTRIQSLWALRRDYGV